MLKVQEVTRNKPKIIVYDVSNKVSERQLTKLIFKINEIDMKWTQFHENYVPKFKTVPKGKENSNWILQLTPVVCNKLITWIGNVVESSTTRLS